MWLDYFPSGLTSFGEITQYLSKASGFEIANIKKLSELFL